jgi:putative spermidine/putrescine transport system substrate-binding protein
MRTRTRVGLVAVVAGILAISACGSSGGSSGGSGSKATGVPALDSLKGRKLVISTWGGVWTDTTKKNLTDPFAKETGVKVQFIVNGNDTVAPALLQVQNHNVQIDLIDGGAAAPLVIHNAAEKFPADLKATLTAASAPGSVTDYIWGGYGTTATMIACNPKIVSKCPTTAAEFWDVKDFPGPRAMSSVPETAMAFALLADGAPTGQMSSLDVPRAINKLKEIKPHIKVWTSSGAQQQQVISDGEVGIEYMWNGRAYVVKNTTVPNLIMNWGGSTYETDSEGFAVPKGAPDADVAFAFMAWVAAHPQNQAAWTSALTYPTPTKNLASLVSPAVAAALPNASRTTNINGVWVAQHSTEVQKAWQQFLTG